MNAGEVTCILGDNGAGQVHAHQDPLRRAPARRGPRARRRRGGPLRLATRRAGRRNRDRLPGPRDGASHVDLAELLPRRRADEGRRPVSPLRPRAREDDGTRELREMGIDIRDPDQPVGTLSGGERQSIGDRSRDLLRCACADPRRAHVGARRQAGGNRAEVHPPGARSGRRRDLHHTQPASRLPGGRPLHPPEPRDA